MSAEHERVGAGSFPSATHAERSVTKTEAGMVGYEYAGPLPPPIVLRHLEEILPGSAERIFSQFEKQAEHRRHGEIIVISSNAFSQRLGAVSAAIIGIGGMGGAIWLLAHGQSVTGFGTLLVALGGIVGTFLYQSGSQEAQRVHKRQSKELEK